MYEIEWRFGKYTGDDSVSVCYDRGVYNFKHHSKPTVGETLRIEDGVKRLCNLTVSEIVEETDTEVEFVANLSTYKWKKIA